MLSLFAVIARKTGIAERSPPASGLSRSRSDARRPVTLGAGSHALSSNHHELRKYFWQPSLENILEKMH